MEAISGQGATSSLFSSEEDESKKIGLLQTKAEDLADKVGAVGRVRLAFPHGDSKSEFAAKVQFNKDFYKVGNLNVFTITDIVEKEAVRLSTKTKASYTDTIYLDQNFDIRRYSKKAQKKQKSRLQIGVVRIRDCQFNIVILSQKSLINGEKVEGSTNEQTTNSVQAKRKTKPRAATKLRDNMTIGHRVAFTMKCSIQTPSEEKLCKIQLFKAYFDNCGDVEKFETYSQTLCKYLSLRSNQLIESNKHQRNLIISLDYTPISFSLTPSEEMCLIGNVIIDQETINLYIKVDGVNEKSSESEEFSEPVAVKETKDKLVPVLEKDLFLTLEIQEVIEQNNLKEKISNTPAWQIRLHEVIASGYLSLKSSSQIDFTNEEYLKLFIQEILKIKEFRPRFLDIIKKKYYKKLKDSQSPEQIERLLAQFTSGSVQSKKPKTKLTRQEKIRRFAKRRFKQIARKKERKEAKIAAQAQRHRVNDFARKFVAKRIQRLFRKRQEQKGATSVQKLVRGWQIRNTISKQNTASIRIQSVVRMGLLNKGKKDR